MPKVSPNLQTLADQLILQRYAPPAVLANEKGDILMSADAPENIWSPPLARPTGISFAMAREGLRYELASAFQKSLRQEGAVQLTGSASTPRAETSLPTSLCRSSTTRNLSAG